MSKKKKTTAAGDDAATSTSTLPQPPANATPQPPKPGVKQADTQPSSSLAISRNKHWRYISAFHGPWLQLPHEILETLAHSNYLAPRPRQTDPSVLYDLLKIRRLVDEAADLAVRAQNGTASSALSNSHNSGNGPGGSLGLSGRGVGANAKLSPERRYRMRELATQKLAMAYRLDEVAASVATMQSASTLDTVANFVLQRAPQNTDAKYVHFFHERIPSRMMAEFTPLEPLNEIIAYEPGHAAPFRTRALTKIFKEDYVGAVQDLTEALALCRLDQAKQRAERSQLVSMKDARDDTERRKMWSRDWMDENKVLDDDQPSGLEMQLLFQRGNQYITLACKYIRLALASFEAAERAKASRLEACEDGQEPPCATSTEMEAYRRGLDARETLRKYAKRALRDYTAFLTHLDYAYTPTRDPEQSLDKLAAIKDRSLNTSTEDRVIELDDNDIDDITPKPSSTALTRRPSSNLQHTTRHSSPRSRNGYSPSPFQAPSVHDVASVLSVSPPTGMPSFPSPTTSSLVSNSALPPPGLSTSTQTHTELLTYHPFLPETLHAFLLTHCLLQTAPTTFHRLAINVARLARLADGYPFFLAARSPARADWAEILRKTDNWIGLPTSWEMLCAPPPPPVAADEQPSRSSQTGATERQDTLVAARKAKEEQQVRRQPPTLTVQQEEDLKARRRERIRKEAVMEALGDERVVDDATFQRAVEAREKRALQDLQMDEKYGGNAGPEVDAARENRATPAQQRKKDGKIGIGSGNGNGTRAMPKKNGVAKDEEYLIGTERAESIAAWVLQAPVTVILEGGATRARKGKKKGKKPDEGVSPVAV